jgi:hypothetical protein
MADRCAPSRQLAEGGPEYELPNLALLLLRGYSVTVTDYQGLGTPGVHTYLNTTAEAHAVLDSIRAAQHLSGPGRTVGGPVGVMGYCLRVSQKTIGTVGKRIWHSAIASATTLGRTWSSLKTCE